MNGYLLLFIPLVDLMRPVSMLAKTSRKVEAICSYEALETFEACALCVREYRVNELHLQLATPTAFSLPNELWGSHAKHFHRCK